MLDRDPHWDQPFGLALSYHQVPTSSDSEVGTGPAQTVQPRRAGPSGTCLSDLGGVIVSAHHIVERRGAGQCKDLGDNSRAPA